MRRTTDLHGGLSLAITTPDIILIQDTREQRGYQSLFRSPCVVDTLSTGDYSLVGLQDRIGIERKSLPDLVSSFTHGRERFEAEFRRARSLEFFAVVIEARLSDITSGAINSGAHPEAILQSILSRSVRYNRPFYFAENRELGARITEGLLLKYARSFIRTVETITRAAHKLESHKSQAI